MNGVNILHIPTYSLTDEPLASTCVQYINTARTTGALISIDASSSSVLKQYGTDRYRALIELLKPEVFLCNEDEAAALGLGAKRPMTGAALTVIKQGPLPVIAVQHDGTTTEVAVTPVANIVDTTGAGDAFAAGFLPHFAKTKETTNAVAQGHAVASRVLQSPGATLNNSQQEESS
jgi:sugar/nucleoside kinase (ribokinase family)